MLQDLVTFNGSVEAAVVVYLLGDILNDFNSTNMADQEQLIEVLYIQCIVVYIHIFTCRAFSIQVTFY